MHTRRVLYANLYLFIIDTVVRVYLLPSLRCITSSDVNDAQI